MPTQNEKQDLASHSDHTLDTNAPDPDGLGTVGLYFFHSSLAIFFAFSIQIDSHFALTKYDVLYLG